MTTANNKMKLSRKIFLNNFPRELCEQNERKPNHLLCCLYKVVYPARMAEYPLAAQNLHLHQVEALLSTTDYELDND